MWFWYLTIQLDCIIAYSIYSITCVVYIHSLSVLPSITLSKPICCDQPLSHSSADTEDKPSDETKLLCKPRSKKPKTMPLAPEDWMSHLKIMDYNRNIVKHLPKFSQWHTSYILASDVKDKKFPWQVLTKIQNVASHHSHFSAWWSGATTLRSGPNQTTKVMCLLPHLDCPYLALCATLKGAGPHLFSNMVRAQTLEENPKPIASTNSTNFRLLECQGASTALTRATFGGLTVSMLSGSKTVDSKSQCQPEHTTSLATTGNKFWAPPRGTLGDGMTRHLSGLMNWWQTWELDGCCLWTHSHCSIVIKMGWSPRKKWVCLADHWQRLPWLVCQVPTLKQCCSYPEKQWSKWVEGLSKDVEMTFGILMSCSKFWRVVSEWEEWRLQIGFGVHLSTGFWSKMERTQSGTTNWQWMLGWIQNLQTTQLKETGILQAHRSGFQSMWCIIVNLQLVRLDSIGALRLD